MYTKNEMNTILIVEKQGVAAHPVRDCVKSIYYYVENYIKTQKQQEKYVVEIPQNITKKIFWVENLPITVEVINFIPGTSNFKLTKQGSGANKYSKYDQLNQDRTKLISSAIKLVAKAYNNELISESILPALYHELNHSYENYRRIVTNKNENEHGGLFFNPSKDVYKNIKNAFKNSTDNIDIAFSEIIYRLINQGEFKAHYNNLYGELEAMNSDDYRTDLSKTYTYKFYNAIKNNYIPTLEKAPGEYWKKYAQLFKTNLNPQQFRSYFLKRVYFLIDTFFRKMGKVASLWYDDKNGYNLTKESIEEWTDDDYTYRFKEIINYVKNM